MIFMTLCSRVGRVLKQSLGFIKRVVTGLLGVLVVAVAMGWLSAYWQDYPYFLLTEWLNFFIS